MSGPQGGGPRGGPSSPSDGVENKSATQTPSLNRLTRTLQRGAAISAVVLVVTQLVSFIQVLAVGRLLSPMEVGVFTGGSVLANFLSEFSEGGLKAALIQREEDGDNDIEKTANTVFWATLGSGTAMTVAAIAFSSAVGWLLDSPDMGHVCAVTAGALGIQALMVVPDGLMQRQFNFKRRLVVDPTKSVTFAGVAIVLSAVGFGVWGLVTALYASQVVALILTWYLAGWYPGKATPSYRLWREMARYAFPLVIYEMGRKVRELAESGIVGRFLGAGPLGFYRYGRRIATLPGTAILQVCSYVLFPAFSRIANDPARLRRGFLRAMQVIWVVTIPTAALLVALGEPLIVVLLGEKWRGAGQVLVGMAGYGPGLALTSVGSETLKGAGLSRRLNWVTFSALAVGVGGLIALLPLGLLGVGLAVSLEVMVSGSLCVALALPLVSVRPSEALGRLVPPLLAALAAGAGIFALEHMALHSDTHGVLVGVGLLIADIVAFFVLFYLALRLIAPAAAAELTGALSQIGDKLRKRRGKPTETPAGGVPTEEIDDDVDVDALTRVIRLWDLEGTRPMSAFDDVTMPMYIPTRRIPPRTVSLSATTPENPRHPHYGRRQMRRYQRQGPPPRR